MKFDKLFQIITEDKKGSPKNRGGRTLHGVKQSAGPMGMPSSSAGTTDNPQLRVPQNKWEFNPAELGGKSGASMESALWKSMINSFGLLLNDDIFAKKVGRIGDTFKNSLDSYKNIKGFDDDGNPIKYDEENQLEKLERNQSKYRSDLEGFRKEILNKESILNKTKLPQDQKDQMFVRMGELEGSIKKLMELNRKSPSPEKEARLKEMDSELNKLIQDHGQATMKPSELNVIQADYDDTVAKFEEWTEKLENTTAELEELYDRINNINETNEKADDRATTGFIDLVQYTAKSLADEYRDKVNEVVMTPLDKIDWTNLNPTKTVDNIAKLDALASDDPDVNPLLGYLERFKRTYADKDFQASRELDRNVNITKIRDRNRLPFMSLLRVYSGLGIKKPSPIELAADSQEHKNATSELETYLKSKSQNSPDTVLSWGDPKEKEHLKGLIMDLALPPAIKTNYVNMLNRPWMVIPRNRMNSFTQLWSSLESDLKRFKPKNESFDQFASKILLERTHNEDDFKINTIEVLNSIKRHK